MVNFALLATSGSESTIVSALSSAFTTAVSDIMSAIGTVLPIGLPVVGAFAVITLGIKIFKKVSKG